MRKKGIVISILGILSVCCLLILLVNLENKKYIMQNGTMLALTLDGESITSFPDYSTGKYTVDIDCENAKGSWKPIKQEDDSYEWGLRLENITGNVACDLDFETKTDSDRLINKVESSATHQTATVTTDKSTFEDETRLSIFSAVDFEEISISNFDANEDEIASSNIAEMDDATAEVVFTHPVEAGYYRICYRSSSEKDYDIGYINIDDVEEITFSGIMDDYECLVTYMSTSSFAMIRYSKDDSASDGDDGIYFYIEKGTYNENIITETIDVGYRYAGKQPNNYVWFNNELWRIIGSIPVTKDDGTNTNLVKIIRNESIGGLAYNSEASNTTWGSNTLYTLLNTKYYGKINATGASPCLGYGASELALCNYTSMGISNNPSDYYGSMIEDVYWNVGVVNDSSTAISMTYVNELRTKSPVSGKIGLMSASDYGYATSGMTYSSMGLSSISSFEENNWLYGQGYEWTLTPQNENRVTLFTYNASVDSSGYANRGCIVRPVVYLNSDVYIATGLGSITAPYIIGI